MKQMRTAQAKLKIVMRPEGETIPFKGTIFLEAIGSIANLPDGNSQFMGWQTNLPPGMPVSKITASMGGHVLNHVGRQKITDVQRFTTYLRYVIALNSRNWSMEAAANSIGESLQTIRNYVDAIDPQLKATWCSLDKNIKMFAIAILRDGNHNPTTGPAYFLNDGDKKAKLLSAEEVAKRIGTRSNSDL